jgi:hypothetical protein
MQVEFLPVRDIEAVAYELLEGYGSKFSPVTTPPVPVEEILESHLALSLQIDDLPTVLRQPDTLGAIRFRQREVLVDQSLDPTVHPQNEGRYRFTLAHELGHWQLHRHVFLQDTTQPLLFGAGAGAELVCRSNSKDRAEWQADMFAGHLLMPKDMVFRVWAAERGSRDPYDGTREVKALTERWGLGEDRTPTVEAARAMARRFKVSGQAMQIRLIGLGLIQTKAQPALLFSSGEGG